MFSKGWGFPNPYCSVCKKWYECFCAFVIFSNFHKISNSHVCVLLPRSRVAPAPLAALYPPPRIQFQPGHVLFSQRAAGGNTKCFVLQKQVNLQLCASVCVGVPPQEPSPAIVSVPAALFLCHIGLCFPRF